jgi:membrane protease YdiL (CAAX protease family)
MLFPGLSAMMRWLLGGVVGAFIFAAIHPQGWLAVPALMSIALAATALRVMRGSLIAPMTLHAINNGVIVLLLIMLTAS